MRLLLDTHVLLWWLLDDARLSARVRELLADADNEPLVSSASGFEIATKHRLGKLWIGELDPTALPGLLAESRMGTLVLTLEHALAAGRLEGPHRDPFDRMLIAQSRIEGLPVATRDPVFEAYGVEVLWQ